MNRLIYPVLISICVLLVYIVVSVAMTRDQKVLGLISPTVEITPYISPSIETPMEVLSATPSAVPSATPSATPISKITIAPTPSPVSSEEVNGYIDRFSAQYSVDPNVLRYIAICESGFNSSATNGPYAGLFQFGTITWKNIRSEIGEDISASLRFDAKDAVQTAAYALSIDKGNIWPNCMP